VSEQQVSESEMKEGKGKGKKGRDSKGQKGTRQQKGRCILSVASLILFLCSYAPPALTLPFLCSDIQHNTHKKKGQRFSLASLSKPTTQRSAVRRKIKLAFKAGTKVSWLVDWLEWNDQAISLMGYRLLSLALAMK
jgi:hypothetical protein